MSHLSANEVNVFFGIWLPLLDFVNKKKGLYPELASMDVGKGMVPRIAGDIAEKLWEDVSLIDEYVAGKPELTAGEKEILLSWKRAKTDNFIYERQIPEGAVFINQDREVYLVKGTSIAFNVMFGGRTLPLALTATLLPFKEVIITDGLIGLMNISYGEDMKKEFRDIYNEARREKRIITSF